MIVKATITETISQDFEVEVTSLETAYEEICKKYNNDEFVLDNATLKDARVEIYEKCEEPEKESN